MRDPLGVLDRSRRRDLDLTHGKIFAARARRRGVEPRRAGVAAPVLVAARLRPRARREARVRRVGHLAVALAEEAQRDAVLQVHLHALLL